MKYTHLQHLVNDYLNVLNPPFAYMLPDYEEAGRLAAKISQLKKEIIAEAVEASEKLIDGLKVLRENDAEFDLLTRDRMNEYDHAVDDQIAAGLRAAQRIIADKIDHNHPDYRVYADACVALSKRDLK